MVGDITPPSSNANTPLRAPISPSPERAAATQNMDVDTAGPSAHASSGDDLAGDDDAELAPSSSTDVEDAEDAPKDAKAPGGKAGGKLPAGQRAFRPKDKELYEADVVERWNKSFGDPFQPKSGATTPSS